MKRCWAVSGNRKDTGVAILTALLFGVLCMGLAVGFLLQVPVDLSATVQLERNTRASYVAEAAIQDTMAWISHELANLREPCTAANPTASRSGSLDGWDWTCRVEPDPGTPPNALTDYRIYRLTAVASQDGEEIYQVDADVQGGQSFARFAIFMDNDGTITYDFIVSQNSEVQGPIHKNRPIRFLVLPSMLGGPAPVTFPFDSVISTTASEHAWYVGGPPSIPYLTNDEYDSILKHGGSDLEYGVAPRNMPGNSDVLAAAAFGGVPPSTLPPGVTVNSLGGVYVEGDVTELRLAVNLNGDFELRVDQSGQITTVIEDVTNDRRLLTDPSGSTTTVPGVGTGVIFVNGDISGLLGTNKGPHTIATKFEDGKDVQISGSITRADTPVGGIPTGTDDRLGIVSNKILIAPESVLPRSVANPLRIYATVMATDIFTVTDRDTGNPGAMAIYGGMSSYKAWYTVNLRLSDFQVISGYGGLSGYGSANIYYDKLLADEPPPEYPTTAPADLSIRSWREQPK